MDMTGQPEFWAAVGLAATIATALATGVSTLAALWWRRQDRTEPEWVFTGVSARWDANEKDDKARPTLVAEVLNAGDGTAFRFVVEGKECAPQVRELRPPTNTLGPRWRDVEVVPLMQPSDQVSILVTCSGADWNVAEVVLEWTPPPTWRGKRRQARFPLRELAPRPRYTRSDWTLERGGVDVYPPEPDDQQLPR